ncbi:polyhydroxybutyrate depolymerase [Ningiella sp. W23]|uniref:extracellular catalytic domain type 2 short-chain-length polyhydroxyalkanoate depolymerase n=1 Tax=Ningiella sp. W23 TaxID=3023715 RepID=UPI00375798FF
MKYFRDLRLVSNNTHALKALKSISSKTKPMCAIAIAVLGLSACGKSPDGNANNSGLNLNLSKTSVSGLSSGGYMATQLQLSHSETIVGAGIIGAGPYYCALGDIAIALGQCVNKASHSIENSPFIAQYETYVKEGLVAKPSSVSDDRVLLIHGKLDDTVNRTAADLLAQQYRMWLPESQFRYVNDQDFGHHMPTVNEGSDCAVSEAPYLGNCNYDGAGEILQHIYGKLNPPVEVKDNAALKHIDLGELTDLSGTSISDEAFIFVPQTCADGQTCSLHLSFHGCNQSSEFVQSAYAENAGFNRWAQSNSIVVLYPQIKKSMMMPLNPQGCWDWWGYTGENYANKQGPQIRAMFEVIQALSSTND